jgi:membrane protease YdiL (CAAX protease family)
MTEATPLPEPQDQPLIQPRPSPPNFAARARDNSFVRLVVAIIVMIGAALGFGAVVHALLGEDFAKTQPGLDLLVDVLSMFVALGAYFAYVHLFERRSVDELSRKGALRELAFGAALGALLLSATVGVMSALGYYSVIGVNDVLIVAPVLGLSITSAVGEEILMRGIFFRLVERALGTWTALAFSALLFGLMHGGNPNASLWTSSAIAIEAGILLGAAYVYTRRLWLVIGLHFAWNFFQGGVFGVPISGHHVQGLLQSEVSGPNLLTGGAFGAEASIFALLFCLSAGLAFVVVAYRQGKFIKPFWRRHAHFAPDQNPSAAR